jgi:predicted metal-dependent phosphoesterase TrpH
MFIQLMKNLDKKLKNAQEAKLESHIDEQKTQARLQQNRALDESLGAEEKYANLEKLLQKYEAEIREHVRVEQQMKIYVENLQESFDEKEKAFKDELEAKKKSIEELENKIIKAEQRATELSAETKVLKELLKNFTINTTNTYNSSSKKPF